MVGICQGGIGFAESEHVLKVDVLKAGKMVTVKDVRDLSKAEL